MVAGLALAVAGFVAGAGFDASRLACIFSRLGAGTTAARGVATPRAPATLAVELARAPVLAKATRSPSRARRPRRVAAGAPDLVDGTTIFERALAHAP